MELLVAATRKASHQLKQCRVEKGRRQWENFVRRVRNKPEGHQRVQGGRIAAPAARVEASWWPGGGC